MTVSIDLDALKAAAERPDSTHALVERRWLRDVHLALSGAAEIRAAPAARPMAEGVGG